MLQGSLLPPYNRLLIPTSIAEKICCVGTWAGGQRGNCQPRVFHATCDGLGHVPRSVFSETHPSSEYTLYTEIPFQCLGLQIYHQISRVETK
jgi:hypothetical protein